jgi:hypothetical protein
VEPLVSVVIPYGDPRGRPEHLATWTREQTLPGDRFQVIVVAGRLAPGEEAALRSYLRPQDRLLRAEARNQFAMYAVGAEAARAELLFFSEDHCLADPGCLEAVVEFFAGSDWAAACVRWGHINKTSVGRMEQLAIDRSTRVWSQEGHWNRVRIRGFGIRREAYRAAGGFDERYGLFAEAILAARLHAAGCRVGSVAGSGIRHINLRYLGEFSRNAWDYTWGECVYSDGHDPDFCQRYFGAPALLEAVGPAPRAELRRRRAALRAVLGRAAVGGPPGRAAVPRLARGWLANLAREAAGPLGPRLGARLAVLRARLRYAFWRFDEGYRFDAFLDFWHATVHRARLEYVARHPRPAPTPLRAPGAEVAEFGPAQLPGPYPVETYRGRTFRWTEPVSTVPFALAPGHYTVEIDTAGLRGPAEELPLALVWQGRLLRPDEVIRHGDRLRLALAPEHFTGGEQWLGVVIPPLPVRGSAERRRLGLPIAALRVAPPVAARSLVSESLPA